MLEEVLNTHSPSTIANILGMDHNTLIKFIDNIYKITRYNKAYYIKLSNQRKKQPKDSHINKIYENITQFLIDLRKNNPF